MTDRSHRQEKRTVLVEGARLYVEARGSGEPLILLHDLTGAGSDWRHVFDLDALAETYRVITPDARGHGRWNPGRAGSSHSSDAPAT